MTLGGIAQWVFPSLLFSLRITPVLAFAPPFSLTPAPVLVRILLGVGLAAAVVSGHSAAATLPDLSPGVVVGASIHELAIGSIFVLAFQLMFAGLYTAGRVIDIQAGFGLATIIDPTTRTQTPLVGTLFAFAAGSVFFGLDGHVELLRILAASLEAAPIAGARFPNELAPLMEYASVIFAMAFGVAGGVILCLFLTDMAITMLSRTVPQMNVLVLGFQAKTLILLLVLPTSLGLSAALLARMIRVTLDALPRIF